MRCLAMIFVLWPASLIAQPICFCFACVNPGVDSLYIPQGGMKPTLVPDQCIRGIRTNDPPLPGDMIYFNHNGFIYVSRVIAVGGQTVELRGGRVSINGQVVPWRPAGLYEQPEGPQGSAGTRARCETGNPPCLVPIIEETIGGTTFSTLDIQPGTGVSDDFGPATVPEGSVFVMQDNRDNSIDSRQPTSAGGLGFISLDAVTGQVRELD